MAIPVAAMFSPGTLRTKMPRAGIHGKVIRLPGATLIGCGPEVTKPLPVNSKIVPSLLFPPPLVVPKRLPLESAYRPAWGLAPLEPLKAANSVIVPDPATTS